MATRINTWFLALMAFLLWPCYVLASPNGDSAAVILTYHRVGEDAYPDTNIRTDQFRAHINELEDDGYTVLPLPDIVLALKNNTELPDKTIAITFEGAYRSALKNALPILLEKQIPFTVFFASDHADSNAQQHMNWADLRRLNRHEFVTTGMHPASYTRLAGESNEEILGQINKARLRFREKLKQEPKLFSYPFGEYSLPYRNLIEAQGFNAAFGLYSGTASAKSDIFALPRFTMTESYGDLERFKLVTNALPFPVSSIEPKDPYLTTNYPAIGFSVPDTLANDLSALSCFVSGQKQPVIEIPGEGRVELRLHAPLPEGRTRINCTLPLPHKKDDTPRWRWFGMLLVNNREQTP